MSITLNSIVTDGVGLQGKAIYISNEQDYAAFSNFLAQASQAIAAHTNLAVPLAVQQLLTQMQIAPVQTTAPTTDTLQELLNSMKEFNRMYGMPVADSPAIDKVVTSVLQQRQAAGNYHCPTAHELVMERIAQFHNIMSKELDESADIVLGKEGAANSVLDVLVNSADWLGDLIIYCLSESAKYGLPMGKILKIIIESNRSKLGEDGNPIIDSNGKVCKGPNFKAPEPAIRELLLEEMVNAEFDGLVQKSKETTFARAAAQADAIKITGRGA